MKSAFIEKIQYFLDRLNGFILNYHSVAKKPPLITTFCGVYRTRMRRL